MNLNHNTRKYHSLMRVGYVLPPLALNLIFGLLSSNEISLLQWLLALALCIIPWASYFRWRQRSNSYLPVFAIVSSMYWVYYALALFWGARTVSGIETVNEQNVADDAITLTLWLTVTGVVSLWCGMKISVSRRIVPETLPRLMDGTLQKHYLRVVLVIGGLLGLSENIPFLLGDGFRQMLTILVSLLPVLAFAIMFRSYLRGEISILDKAILVGFLSLRFFVGVSSGWLGSFASIMIVCGAVYVLERRRIPTVAVLLVVVFTLFFQVGKKEFRQTYWQGEQETGKIEKVEFWIQTSVEKWSNAFSDETGDALRESINASLSRVSLLTQTANVLDMTPSLVPYQYSRLYSYMAITWIPRFLWPDKPSMSEANRFYQVAYGLSTTEALESVSIGVGVMTEAYISFGWLGVIGIMFLMGVFYDIYQQTFFSRESGALMVGLGVAMLPQLLTLESQMAAYLSGIVQQVLLTLIVFLPIVRFRASADVRLPLTQVQLSR